VEVDPERWSISKSGGARLGLPHMAGTLLAR
jgi:hypothetical protein